MTTLSRRRIRAKLDAAKRTTDRFTDVKTSSSPELWRGNDVQFELGIFWNDALVTDITNLASITVDVRSGTAVGALLMTKTLSAVDLDTSLTAGTWADDSKQHALIAFTGTETNVPAGAHWLVISAVTNDTPSRSITLAATTLLVAEDGAGTEDNPDPVTGISYTRPEADARFMQIHADGSYWRYHNNTLYGYAISTDLWYPITISIIDGIPTLTLGPGETL
jgi:hypothetical protein